MSTRCAIITKTETGYAGIYCHHDGYPAWVGEILHENYQDGGKVRALIDLGHISTLGGVIGPQELPPATIATSAYMRDLGEQGQEAIEGSTSAEVAENIGHDENVYVWDGGWTWNGQPLAEAIKNH